MPWKPVSEFWIFLLFDTRNFHLVLDLQQTKRAKANHGLDLILGKNLADIIYLFM